MRDTLYEGRPFRTLNVIDEGNREALRIECGTSIPSARKSIQNAFVDRFNMSFGDEVLDANLFNSIADAQEADEVWVMDYNEIKPNDNLGDITPMEFMPRTFETRISSFEFSI
jgi:putative transposase